MKYYNINGNTPFGPVDAFKEEELKVLREKAEGYLKSKRPKAKNMQLIEVEYDDCPSNKEVIPLHRIDVSIQYNEDGICIRQKLLFLKGELLDGQEFHKRHQEFYR